MRLQTSSEIFCSHPTNKQWLVDIVADPINDSPLPNLSTRSDSDKDWLIVMCVFSTIWTSVMDHLQIFVKNDGTNKDIHAADRVIIGCASLQLQ